MIELQITAATVVTGIVVSLYCLMFGLIAIVGRVVCRLPIRPHLIPVLTSILLPAFFSSIVQYEPRLSLIGLLGVLFSWTVGMMYLLFIIPAKLWWWNLWAEDGLLSIRKS